MPWAAGVYNVDTILIFFLAGALIFLPQNVAFRLRIRGINFHVVLVISSCLIDNAGMFLFYIVFDLQCYSEFACSFLIVLSIHHLQMQDMLLRICYKIHPI